MEKISMGENEISFKVDEEATLVQAAREDPEAFARLYHRYVTPVYRYLYQRVDSASDAEDLTTQTFIAALESLVHYREQGRFSAWLFTIARRKTIAYYRGRRENLNLEIARDHSEDQGDLLEAVAHQETLSGISELIAALDEEEKELLRLRFSAALTYKEIGTLVGRSEPAVKMAIHRLLDRLQAAWEERS